MSRNNTFLCRLAMVLLLSIMVMPVSAERLSHTFSAGELAITTTYDHEGTTVVGHYAGPIRMCGITWMVDYTFDGEAPVVMPAEDGGVYIGPSEDGYGSIDNITLRSLDHYNCDIHTIYLNGSPAQTGSDISVTAPSNKNYTLDGETTIPDNYFYGSLAYGFEIKIDCTGARGIVLRSLDVDYDDYRPVANCPSFVPVGKDGTYEFAEGSTIVVGDDVPVENYTLEGNRLIVHGYTPVTVTPPQPEAIKNKPCAQEVHFYPFTADESRQGATLLYSDGPLMEWPIEELTYERAAVAGGKETFDVKVSRDDYQDNGTLIMPGNSFREQYVRLSTNGTLDISAKDPSDKIRCVILGELPQSNGLLEADKIVTEPESDYSCANNQHVFVPRSSTTTLKISHTDAKHDFNMSKVTVHYASDTSGIDHPSTVQETNVNTQETYYDLTGRVVTNPRPGIYVKVSPVGATKVLIR